MQYPPVQVRCSRVSSFWPYARVSAYTASIRNEKSFAPGIRRGLAACPCLKTRKSPMFRWFETRIDPVCRGSPGPAAGEACRILLALYPPRLAALRRAARRRLLRLAHRGHADGLRRRPRRHDARRRPTPAQFFADNQWTLIGMAFVALIARPGVSALHDLVKNQMITANSDGAASAGRRTPTCCASRSASSRTTLPAASRRASCRRARRLRESVVQAVDAIWYMAVHIAGALVIFWEADFRLTLPLLAWIGLYFVVLRSLRPAHPEALDGSVRGALVAHRPRRRQLSPTS